MFKHFPLQIYSEEQIVPIRCENWQYSISEQTSNFEFDQKLNEPV